MKKSTDNSLAMSTDYRRFIEGLKARVTVARISAARAVDRDVILLYWEDRAGDHGKATVAGLGEIRRGLRTKANPIGVAACHLRSKLPGELKGKLPTAKQLAEIVRAEMDEGK